MFNKICAITLALCISLPLMARVPGNDLVTPDRVTDEELYVIAKWEDAELWKGIKTESNIHYPLEDSAAGCTSRGCTNGCTIGYGYNLGAHDSSKIRSDFRKAGISEDKTDRLIPLAQVTGINAVIMCGRDQPMRDRFPTLTREESAALLRVMVKEHKDNVVRRARREGILRLFNSGQFAVMVALDYQNPVLSSRAKYIWLQLKAGDMDAVLENIEEHMGTHLEPGLRGRRFWEADYFAWATSRQIASGMYLWPIVTS